MNKAKRLRDLLFSNKTDYMIEAHNGLSAKIAEEAGFKSIWASSFSLSASMGRRDCNELSWSQVLNIVDFMNEAVTAPILLDADTGYGNFNSVRLLVRQLEKLGIAGMCIEDKVFPKNNSFVVSKLNQLAPIREFTGKIKAAKDSQNCEDFVVVARLEGLVLGAPLGEVLDRAHAYQSAGADALLIHSKESTAAQVLSFAKAWGNRTPIAIVPTTYHQTPAHIFEQAGVNLVIWANHLMRAAVKSMQEIAHSIFQGKSIKEAETTIAPLSEIFRLQDVQELTQAEKKYL